MKTMSTQTRQAIAEQFLKKADYTILDMDSRPCERDKRCVIDVIATLPNDAKTVVFFAVKWRSKRTVKTLLAEDRRKRNIMLRACTNWILKNRWNYNFRHDEIHIFGGVDELPLEIDHYEDVALFPLRWRFW